MKSVNFIKKRQEKIKLKKKKLFYVQLAAFCLLCAYSLAIIGFYSYFFILKQQLNLLSKKIQVQEERIENFVGTETKQVYLKKKTGNLNTILQNTKDHQEIVESFFSILPQGVEVDDFNVSENGLIKFTGSALTFDSLKVLLDTIKGKSLGNLPIAYAGVDNFSLNGEKEIGYNFGITLYLQKK